MTGYEALQKLQGWVLQQVPETMDKVEDGSFADLAGKAICGNVLMSIFSALFVAIEWESQAESRETANRRSVLASLKR